MMQRQITAYSPFRLPLAIFLLVTVTGISADSVDTDKDTLLPIPEAQVEMVPPPRSHAEVTDILKGKSEQIATRPIHIVLVAGRKDHGPGAHDYPAWQKAWMNLFSEAKNTKVTTAWEKPSPEDFKSADVMVLCRHRAWPKEVNQQIEAYFARGGGMVLLHYAVDGAANPESVGNHIGLHWGRGCRWRHGWIDLKFDAASDNPILRNLKGKALRFHDEAYWRLKGDPKGIQVLATGVEKEKDGTVTIPLIWTRETGKGRVNVNILGHNNWTFNDPLFRVLVFRSIAWVAKEPVDRFNDLVTVDVALKD